MAGNPNTLVTRFPGPNHARLVPGSEQMLIDAAQAELAILGELGEGRIIIPEVGYRITTTTSEYPQIEVTTGLVEADSFTPPVDWPHPAHEAPHQDKAADLAELLGGYYDRVLRDQPELFLGDIADVRGWAVTPAGSLALRNTAPLMIGGQGRTGVLNVKVQYSRVYDWVRNLQPPTDDRNVMLKLSLWDKLSSFDK